MVAASLAAAVPATQFPGATRKERLANLRGWTAAKVTKIRTGLSNLAPRGLATDLAEAMEWRAERRSRELGAVEKLSIEDYIGEIGIHIIDGRQEAVDVLVGALLEGIRTSEIPIEPGSVIRAFGRNGQLFLRFER